MTIIEQAKKTKKRLYTGGISEYFHYNGKKYIRRMLAGSVEVESGIFLDLWTGEIFSK